MRHFREKCHNQNILKIISIRNIHTYRVTSDFVSQREKAEKVRPPKIEFFRIFVHIPISFGHPITKLDAVRNRKK